MSIVIPMLIFFSNFSFTSNILMLPLLCNNGHAGPLS